MGKRVLLVDAHLGNPGVHSLLNLSTVAAQASLLRSGPVQLPVQQLTPRLFVLPAGGVDTAGDPALPLHRIMAVVEDAVSRHDWVLVDAPTAEAADTRELISVVRTALLVIRSAGTSCHDVERAIAAIGRSCIVGTVLNRATGG